MVPPIDDFQKVYVGMQLAPLSNSLNEASAQTFQPKYRALAPTENNSKVFFATCMPPRKIERMDTSPDSTWNLKIIHEKRNNIFQTSIFGVPNLSLSTGGTKDIWPWQRYLQNQIIEKILWGYASIREKFGGAANSPLFRVFPYDSYLHGAISPKINGRK